MNAQLLARILLSALLLSAAGCMVSGDEGRDVRGRQAAPEVIEQPSVVEPVPLPQAAPLHAPQPVVPATGKLLVQSREASARHDTAQAISFAERAQRIDPRNPAIYQWLAELYRESGDVAQSQQMAQRGLRYASDAQQRTTLEQLAQ